MNELKTQKIQWLARVYNGEPDAISDAAADINLFDRMNDFGLGQFLATFRPLVKLREQRGDLAFEVGDVNHVAADLSFAQFLLDGEICFEVRIRFEPVAPFRIHYWGSYPPVSDGVELRRYRPSDAPACVALEAACPMELEDGTTWVVDRGDAFDDYLTLMGQIDAAVVTAQSEVVGFFSSALRPIGYKGEECYAVYQHHYRVHPDRREGNISNALANFVDPRRTFEKYPVQFPYSLIDPQNVHMKNTGFPIAEGISIARLSIPVSVGIGASLAAPLALPSVTRICEIVNTTHGERELFLEYNRMRLSERLSRVSSYQIDCFRQLGSSIIGVWQVNELNLLTKNSQTTEQRLSFALDYGFQDLAEFEQLIRSICAEVADAGATHLSFMCDTKASEYNLLNSLADDEQLFALHTLPWIGPELGARILYCDAVYS